MVEDDDGVTSAAFAACADRVSGIVALLTDRIDDALLARTPMLKVVANVAVGVDNVDVTACAARSVIVTNTPDVLTEATADLWRILVGLGALAVASLPFMFLGISIGYSMPSKAAIAVVQVVMFGLAFGGGLFLPPFLFADWLNALSQFLPSRQARELVIWAVQGGELEPWVWVGILLWTAGSLALALVLFRRDEGRRYR